MKLTVIVPCYNEEEALLYFQKEIDRISKQMPQVEFEFLYIEDGSHDKTLIVIKQLASKDSRIKYIAFSRNFGKESAIYAGLQNSTGDLVAILDADLQDPPELLLEMYHAITEEGYDCVASRRVSRKGEPAIRSVFARWFYKIMNRISKIEIVDGARDFRLMTRQYVNAVLQMKEYNRFSKGMFGWIGFQTKWLEFENIKRVAGETKWSFWKLLLYSIEGIVNFSTFPLTIASLIGTLTCTLSGIAIVFIILRQLLYGGSAFGWPSTMCVVIFLGGTQLLCVGILGSYLSRTYLEVKRRPIYLKKETNILEIKQEG